MIFIRLMTDAEFEAECVSDSELEAAGFMYDVLAKEGWDGWLKRNDEAVSWLSLRFAPSRFFVTLWDRS